MEFTFQKRVYENFDIDFQKICDYIREEYKGSDVDIIEIFGDNVEYYLEKTHGIVIYICADDDGILYDDNEAVLDDIFYKFENWFNKNKRYLNIIEIY